MEDQVRYFLELLEQCEDALAWLADRNDPWTVELRKDIEDLYAKAMHSLAELRGKT